MTKKTSFDISFTQPFSKENFNTLTVSLRHNKAGVSYFTGNRRTAGHVLSFSPCTHQPNGLTMSVMLSGDQWTQGFYVQLDNVERKNPHALARYADVLSETPSVLESIRDAYEHKDGAGLNTIANDLRIMAEQKAPKKRVTKALTTA